MEILEGHNKFYVNDAEGNQVAEIVFVPTGEHLSIIEHTDVDPSLKGQGVGSKREVGDDQNIANAPCLGLMEKIISFFVVGCTKCNSRAQRESSIRLFSVSWEMFP